MAREGFGDVAADDAGGSYDGTVFAGEGKGHAGSCVMMLVIAMERVGLDVVGGDGSTGSEFLILEGVWR